MGNCRLPASTGCRPQSARTSVLFPQPLGPGCNRRGVGWGVGGDWGAGSKSEWWQQQAAGVQACLSTGGIAAGAQRAQRQSSSMQQLTPPASAQEHLNTRPGRAAGTSPEISKCCPGRSCKSRSATASLPTGVLMARPCRHSSGSTLQPSLLPAGWPAGQTAPAASTAASTAGGAFVKRVAG